MEKVVIFTEGQSEQIFARNILMKVIDISKLSFECLQLRAETLRPARFCFASPTATVHFMIIDVGNDEKVTSAIKEREKNLLSAGYQRIIGLRDMYCAAYDNRARGEIKEEVSQDIARAALQEINGMSKPECISIFFEIMEFEAWILGMYDLFRKVDARLSIDNIRYHTGIDLRSIDPQKQFYKPSEILKQILSIADIEYRKRGDDTEKLCAVMDLEDFESAIEGERCTSFREFYIELKACYTNA